MAHAYPHKHTCARVAQDDEPALSVGPYTVGSEQFFLEVALRELVAMARDAALAHTHERVLRCLGILAVRAGAKLRFALPSIMAAIAHTVAVSNASTRAAKLKELATVMGVMGAAVAPYYPAIFAQLREYWLPAQQAARATPPPVHAALLSICRKALEHAPDALADQVRTRQGR